LQSIIKKNVGQPWLSGRYLPVDIQNGVHSSSNAYLHWISLWNELVWYYGARIVYNIFELLDKSAVKLETKNDRHDCCQEHNCISFVSFVVYNKSVYNNIADFSRQWSLFCKHDIRKEKIHKKRRPLCTVYFIYLSRSGRRLHIAIISCRTCLHECSIQSRLAIICVKMAKNWVKKQAKRPYKNGGTTSSKKILTHVDDLCKKFCIQKRLYRL
jgi:hypothetical protein